MSLINQALKKEQQRRSLNLRDTTPDVPTYDSGYAGNGLSPSTRQSNRSLSLLIGFTGVGALLLLVGGGFVYFGKSYLEQLNATPVVAQESSEGTAFASNTPETPVATVTDILNEIEEEKQVLQPVEVSEAEESIPDNLSDPSIDTEVAREAVDGVSTEEVGANEETATKEPPEPVFDYKIQDLIDAMQVLGYRSAGQNSRLLMNGRVYKINDIVNNEHQLRFLGSDGENLVFETPSGYRYSKPL